MNRPLALFILVTAIVSSTLFAQESLPPGKAAPGKSTGSKATGGKSAATKAGKSTGELKTQEERQSYAIGLDIGNMLKAQGIQVDLELCLRGIRDSLAGNEPALSKEELQETMTALGQQVQERQKKAAEEIAAQNKKQGEEFLAKNAKKEGVTTTKSGLQYKVLKEGNGPSPKATDMVRTHYRGTFLNGQVFDSSYERGEPAVFPLNRVIPGWTEALQEMKVGSKWQLFVPANLAYGERGSDDIPPNATLIFEVELLGIEKAESQSE